MLKLLGCVCILAASSGMAYSLIAGLSCELRQLEELLDLLLALEGEIAYCRSPLPELLRQLSETAGDAYREILAEAGRRMEESEEADMAALWRETCARHRAGLRIRDAGYQALARIGEVFVYTSLESSLQLLRLNQEKLKGVLAGKRGEFADRRKLYGCICYMAGLLSIILLL